MPPSTTPDRLRLAFFGLPLAALLLERDGHDVVLCSVSRTDAPGLRRARRLFEDRVLVRPDVQASTFRERLEALEPDLVVSWFWTTRLPMKLVEIARLGGINVHPSLLPRHRGPDPTTWAILLGDEESGVTVHRLAEEYDSGNIIEREKISIEPTWNAWQLARALDRPSLRVLRRTVQNLTTNGRLPEIPQDPALATDAPFLDDEASAICWSWPTQHVLRHVRALAPAPGAWTEMNGSVVTVLRAAVAPVVPKVLRPGEATVMDDQALVRTADGAIVLLQAEIDGEPAAAPRLAELVRSHAQSAFDVQISQE
ncbi:uncharacterized protein CMC5_007320 [Chondromyces crocatus]|uniref:Uncharacterized protein n=1 Tax=Chondromyces crocatus TaxID=52 RepID=A0A0K1E7G4_CHOCO|nr:uncharacterized protein CMC5_007320 [Chondromyces crocatus]